MGAQQLIHIPGKPKPVPAPLVRVEVWPDGVRVEKSGDITDAEFHEIMGKMGAQFVKLASDAQAEVKTNERPH